MRSSVDLRSLLLAMPRPDSFGRVSSMEMIWFGSRVNGTRTFMLRLYVAIIASSPGRMAVLHEVLHLLEDAVAVEGREREVVDVEDDAPLHVLGDFLAVAARERAARTVADGVSSRGCPGPRRSSRSASGRRSRGSRSRPSSVP